MAKKILVVTGSPRHFSNSTTMAERVVSGAREKGAEVKIVNGARLQSSLAGCSGCQACQNSSEWRCVIPDDVSELIASIPSYDVLILATPVYFFNFSAQMKLIMDRFQALVKEKDGEFISPLKNIQIALVVSAGGDEKDSGLEVLKLNMKYLTEFVGAPPVKVFFKGLTNHDSTELWEDHALHDQAAEFGRMLAD